MSRPTNRPNKTEYYWWPLTKTVPTISVFDLSNEAKEETREKIKKGARVVPFGFSRALPSDQPTAEPLLWEGD